MSTLVINRPKASRLEITDDYLVVYLTDARILQVPIAWFPKLLNATPEQRQRFNVIGKGTGFEWEELDEHLSVEGFLFGPGGAAR